MEIIEIGGRRIAKVPVTSKGQATIPLEFRTKYGIGAPGEAMIVDEGDRLVFKPIPSPREMQGILKGRGLGDVTGDMRRERRADLEREKRKFGL